METVLVLFSEGKGHCFFLCLHEAKSSEVGSLDCQFTPLHLDGFIRRASVSDDLPDAYDVDTAAWREDVGQAAVQLD